MFHKCVNVLAQNVMDRVVDTFAPFRFVALHVERDIQRIRDMVADGVAYCCLFHTHD